MLRVSFHPAARQELLKYRRWYLERSVSAAGGFEREVAHAVERILEAPERYPVTRWSRRRFVLFEYPFDIIYRIRDTDVQIMAVAHHSRRPGYWRSRN